MKRFLLLVLALALCLPMCACNTDQGVFTNKNSFVGLYKNSDNSIYIPAKVDGGGVLLTCDRFFELNSDGSGNSYYEIVKDDDRVSEEVKKEKLESMKSTVTWKEDDGYLVIYYEDGAVSSFEKKGAHFFSVTNESYVLVKVS